MQKRLYLLPLLALGNVDVNRRGGECLPLGRLKGVHIGQPPRQVVHVLILPMMACRQPVVDQCVRLTWAWPSYETALEQHRIQEASPRLSFQVRDFHHSVTNSGLPPKKPKLVQMLNYTFEIHTVKFNT